MITFIDANCMIGPRQHVREGALKSTPEFVHLMDELGISQAIAYHSASKEADPKLGNELLFEETKGYSKFIFQWGVMPDIWDGFYKSEELSKKMKKNDIRCVRLFPKTCGYSLEPYVSEELLTFLTNHKIPVFIDRSEFSTWNELYELCTSYSNGIFILCDTSYDCLRQLVPIMEQCQNLFIETSTLFMHQSIRDFCFHFGAERLVFGSSAPIHSMAAAVSLIRYSDISQREKEMIASRNIERLLKEVLL